jgi:antitoxin component YwqK of YwqJK toxin-antitoxin module
MKKILPIITAIILIYSCSNREHKRVDSLSRTKYYFDEAGTQTSKKADYSIILETDSFGKEIELKHGTYKEYYLSGKPMQVLNYRKDKLEGSSTTYYENGQISEISNWAVDEYDGEYKYYLENGIIQQELNYRKGLLNGSCKTYYSRGNIKTDIIYKDNLPWELIANYDSTGIKLDSSTVINGQGKFCEYNPNGELSMQIELVNGLFNGSLEIFDKNIPRMKITYQNGKKNGDFYAFHENGAIAHHATFFLNIKIGIEKRYNNKGVLISLKNYKSPPFNKMDSLELQIGKYTRNSNIGVLINSFDPMGLINNGIKIGTDKDYYDNGNLKSESYFSNNTQDSIYRQYYVNGYIKKEMYIDNTYEDRTRYIITHNENGDLIDSIVNKKRY